MGLLFEGSETPFMNIDSPSVRNETKADVERHRFGSQLQHRGKGRCILRGLDAIVRQILRRELEKPSSLDRGHLSIGRHPDRLGIAELGGSRSKFCEVLPPGTEIPVRIKALAS